MTAASSAMNRSATATAEPFRKGLGLFLLLLTGVLAFLFRDSFRSGVVLFANDGPLGVLMSQALSVPAIFTGYWMDLNWVGMNGGTAPASVTYLLTWLLGPVGFAKFYGPITLWLLGLAAWIFFRTLELKPGFCSLAGLAAALNSNFFSNTCWGLGTRSLTLASVFLALTALMSGRAGPRWRQIVLTALAGLAVGLAVIEGADNGAIFSLFAAAFVLFQSFVERPALAGLLTGAARLVLVSVAAALLATQVLIPLAGIAAQGSAPPAEPDPAQTPEFKWAFATQWSLPPIESLRVVIPGLFGYQTVRPDGQAYWGRVGEWPLNPEAARRSSGAGEYAGVLVVLVAFWALVQSLSRPRAGPQPFTDRERKFIWFWGAMAVVALVLSWGRHAPFYRLVYALPFFSSIRNPMKFMHPCHLALLVLFGYGLLGLSRRYLETGGPGVVLGKGFSGRFKEWWIRAQTCEKRWFLGSAAMLALSGLAFLIYSAARSDLVRHLQQVGFIQGSQAELIARTSVKEVGIYVVVLLVSVAALTLVQMGALAGPRRRGAMILFGFILVLDLARADTPWIVHYNYREQYASNPLLEILRREPWQGRVTMFPVSMLQSRNPQLEALNQIYQGLWLQHHFQWDNIQSLDLPQEPRPPADKVAYLKAVTRPISRLWELANTRYILGLAGNFVDVLNQQLGNGTNSFRIHTAFNLTQDRNAPVYGVQTNTTGPWALIEFRGALPRAKLYSHWSVSTNDTATLATLGDPGFDPARMVLVNTALAQAQPPAADHPSAEAGRVEIVRYAPKHLELTAHVDSTSILLINDRFDPAWKAWVDGNPAPLLRCNFLMRGLRLSPGEHRVVLRFKPSLASLKITLATAAAGIILGALLFLNRVRGRSARRANTR
jgi:hypothetical protein